MSTVAAGIAGSDARLLDGEKVLGIFSSSRKHARNVCLSFLAIVISFPAVYLYMNYGLLLHHALMPLILGFTPSLVWIGVLGSFSLFRLPRIAGGGKYIVTDRRLILEPARWKNKSFPLPFEEIERVVLVRRSKYSTISVLTKEHMAMIMKTFEIKHPEIIIRDLDPETLKGLDPRARKLYSRHVFSFYRKLQFHVSMRYLVPEDGYSAYNILKLYVKASLR